METSAAAAALEAPVAAAVTSPSIEAPQSWPERLRMQPSAHSAAGCRQPGRLVYAVEAEAGPNSDYQFGARKALPPYLLTNNSRSRVPIGLRTAASGGVAGYEEETMTALAELEQVLPGHLRARLSTLNTVARAGGIRRDDVRRPTSC